MLQAVWRGCWRVLLAGCVTAAAWALTGCDAQAPATYSGYWYTCCSADFGATVWHPGQTLRVTWSPVRERIRVAVGTARITLTVMLTGPYSSVSALKSAGLPRGRVPLAAAPAIHATTRAGGAPVSVLVIPRDAPAGFYDLQFGISSGGGSVTGSSVVQVAP